MKFSLTTIAYVFALLAAAMATFGVPLGVVASLLVLAYWRLGPWWRRNFFGLLVILMVLIVAAALLVPVHHGREASRCWRCRGNLQGVARGVQAYQRRHGTLPPAGEALPPAGEAQSLAMSWRVAILPWLEERDVYEAYRRDEAWNGPNNTQVTLQPHFSFECPSDPMVTPMAARTSYFAIVDERTVWGGREPGQRQDRPGQTIMLIEAAGLTVPWAAPRDLSFDEALALLTGDAPTQVVHIERPGPGFFEKGYGENREGVHVAFANGEVGFVPVPISTKLATAMLTANGGEAIDQGEIDRFLGPQADYGKVYAFVTFIALALVPGVVRVVRWVKSI
jgi:hypothetical protein